MNQGTIEGLPVLHQQAAAYYRHLAHAQAADAYSAQRLARAAQALAGLALYMDQLNYQQRLINALNRLRTCSTIGNVMTWY